MGVYEENDYRKTLKTRMRELQKLRPGMTWRKLANEIPIQYTYLSKALNDETTHLSDDHLFVICRALEFQPEDADYIALQRSLATSRDPERKTFLARKLRERQSSKDLNARGQTLEAKKLNEQIQYLFEPLCLVVHQALELDQFRNDPRKLCGPLTLAVSQLREILRVLSRNDYIDLDDDGLTVKKVKQANIHFGPEHFLMRYHLSMVKSQMIARLARTPEDEKFSFLVTFTMDDTSYEKIRQEFRTFLKNVEQIAARSKSKHVYQLSFDIFKWI